MPVLPSYRNQHSKSIDWFLYEGNTEWVNIWKRKKSVFHKNYVMIQPKFLRICVKSDKAKRIVLTELFSIVFKN